MGRAAAPKIVPHAFAAVAEPHSAAGDAVLPCSVLPLCDEPVLGTHRIHRRRRAGLLARVDAKAAERPQRTIETLAAGEPRQPQYQVVIHRVMKPHVELAEPLVQLAAPEHRLGVAEDPLSDELSPGVRQAEVVRADPIIEVERVPVAIHDLNLWPVAEYAGDEPESPRTVDVIAVQPATDIAGDVLEPLVERVALSAVTLAAPQGDVGRVLLENRPGAIARAAIHDDQLHVGVVLVDYRQQALFDQRSVVVGRHDEREARRDGRRVDPTGLGAARSLPAADEPAQFARAEKKP